MEKPPKVECTKDDGLAQIVLSVIDEVVELSVVGGTPREDILKYRVGDDPLSIPTCGSVSNNETAQLINERANRSFYPAESNHQKPVRTHVYLVEQASNPEDDLIIDPVALMFFQQVPNDMIKFFQGSMFIGKRGKLKKIVTHPQTILQRCSTCEDKELSFQRIWGEVSFRWRYAT